VGPAKKKTKMRPDPLPVEALRWRCDPDELPFDSTSDVNPSTGAIGQDDAVEALRFGLTTKAPGHNIFVRGLSGTGRLRLVQRLLVENDIKSSNLKDCCYVHNFQQPDRPRLITLPPGKGKVLKKCIEKLTKFILKALKEVLTSEGVQAQQDVLEQKAQGSIEFLVKPFEEALNKAGLKLVTIQAGSVSQTTIFPIVDDKPIPMEEFNKLHQQGDISDNRVNQIAQDLPKFEKRLSDIDEQGKQIRADLEDAMASLIEKSARWILSEVTRDILQEFQDSNVQQYLDEIVSDVVDNRLASLVEEEDDFTRIYRVNVVLENQDNVDCPIIAENTPTMRNLLGAIDFEFGPNDEIRANHMGIKAGSILRADGGYLVMDVRDLLSESGAWKSLIRTLRNKQLEIVPPESVGGRTGPTLKPEPIKINTKVVLLGDSEIYYVLDAQDPDFPQLFKVLADFDSIIPRSVDGIRHYAEILSRIAREEQLPSFDRTAIAALAEHGVRIAGKNNLLTTRFSRIADIAREAAFIAIQTNGKHVSSDDVNTAIRKGKRRADLPSRKFRELVSEGTLHLETKGSSVGQINGLAVMQAGPMVYGFPARITATIGPGSAGVINIEREAALSGAIHTKGFYILGGLLRYLLRTNHPLAFDASVAFEQSYGGIDGDSASGAEMCCLISALTGIPIKQSLAMTGAIDQVGNILAIGAANEKIEGFFDTCNDTGLTGTQGVIIPQTNVNDLMLKQEVIDACAAGRFFIYPVKTIFEAISLFTGKSAGRRNRKGEYPANSVLGVAVQQAYNYWDMAAKGSLRKKDISEEETDN